MKARGKIIGRLIVGCVLACCFASQLHALTYYLQTQGGVPYPLDPYGGTLPVVALDAARKIYQIQDTPKDFAALQLALKAKASDALSSDTADGIMSPNNFDTPEESGFHLNIAADDDNYTRVIHFATTPGSLYNLESSTNLTDWVVEQTFVATDTNFIFWAAPEGNKFYRASLPDDRLQFPDWSDYVEAFAYFNVHSTIQGTYHLELYADGSLLYENTAEVPTDGNFGVYDSSYDPAQWPNVADYAVEEWELRVTVTPAVAPMWSGGSGSPTANLKKKQRHPKYPRYGLTVGREGVGAGVAPGIQDQIDMYMLGYLQASANNVASQYSLANYYIDPSTAQYFNVPKLTDSNSWNQFKWFINNPNLTDLHYYGHGSRRGIGDSLSDPTTSISLAEFQNTNRLKHPLKYAFLDGCQTASGNYFWQNSKLLEALCGLDRKLTMLDASAQGKWPRFACGWTVNKQINFGNGTYLNTWHFIFIADFYLTLSHRDGSGYLDRSFDQAIYFGQNPMGAGTGGFGMTTNPDGLDLDYLGCGEARWDD
jgi:hypothetical protein